MRIIHEDGRTFLNKNTKTYDAIFLDAYKSFSVPFHLTTKEAVEKMRNSLDYRGVVLANLISSATGTRGKFFRAQYRTFKEVFPYVYVFLTNPDASIVQNIILVGAKSGPTNIAAGNLFKGLIEQDVPVLTDDYAPVEQYMAL